MKMKPATTLASEASENWEVQVRKGCLELAILAALWSGKLYGLEILRRLEAGSRLVVPEGTVYPLLSRLKSEGWLDSEWVEADSGHPREVLPADRQRTAARSADGPLLVDLFRQSRPSSGAAAKGRILMSNQDDAQARINAYLQEVRQALAGLPRHEASEIVEELRSHIRDSADLVN